MRRRRSRLLPVPLKMSLKNILKFGFIISVCSWSRTRGDLSPKAKESTCSDGWSFFGDSCYFYSGGSGEGSYRTWDEAQGACYAVGGHLVEIESATENTFLIDLQKNFSSYLMAWIGLHDREKKGTFIWASTGKVTSYTNWGTDEPNNNYGTCCEMDSTGLWNDISCESKRPYFCERLVGAVCPTGWTFFRKDCYKFRNTEKTWDDAEAACSVDGGHLVDITSAAEDIFLFNLMNAYSRNPIWIGLDGRKINSGVSHVWALSGVVATYMNFSNFEFYGDRCVELYTCKTVFWIKSGCKFRREYFCERPVSEGCREGWSLFNRRCYKYSASKASWDSAQSACNDSVGGGSLAEITSAAENAFLSNLRKKYVRNAWIGLKRVGSDFIWMPSVIFADYFNWANWASGEPNNYDHAQNCVEMKKDGKWDDRGCTRLNNYICEQQPIIIPWKMKI